MLGASGMTQSFSLSDLTPGPACRRWALGLLSGEQEEGRGVPPRWAVCPTHRPTPATYIHPHRAALARTLATTPTPSCPATNGNLAWS